MTTLFPVINSTLCDKALGNYIQEKYSFTNEIKCTLFRAAMNHLYIVEDGNDKYVFRVYTYNWRTKSEIQEELRLLNYLKEKQASISFPILDNCSEIIQEFYVSEGRRFGVLFSYAKGKKVAGFSVETSCQIGVALGKVHKNMRGFFIGQE
jgi:Ser/Thr protein kinase RdoA (MazF antagonist)